MRAAAAAVDDVAYLDAHGPLLEIAFDEALQAVLAAKPADSVAFMVSFFAKRTSVAAPLIAAQQLAEASPPPSALLSRGARAHPERWCPQQQGHCACAWPCPASRCECLQSAPRGGVTGELTSTNSIGLVACSLAGPSCGCTCCTRAGLSDKNCPVVIRRPLIGDAH